MRDLRAARTRPTRAAINQIYEISPAFL